MDSDFEKGFGKAMYLLLEDRKPLNSFLKFVDSYTKDNCCDLEYKLGMIRAYDKYNESMLKFKPEHRNLGKFYEAEDYFDLVKKLRTELIKLEKENSQFDLKSKQFFEKVYNTFLQEPMLAECLNLPNVNQERLIRHSAFCLKLINTPLFNHDI